MRRTEKRHPPPWTRPPGTRASACQTSLPLTSADRVTCLRSAPWKPSVSSRAVWTRYVAGGLRGDIAEELHALFQFYQRPESEKMTPCAMLPA